MKATINYLDCCLSDYFQGSSNEVIAVPVDNEMPCSAVWTSMDEELDGYEWNDEQWAAVNAAVHKGHMEASRDIAFPNLDACCDDECCDCELVYAYFDVTFEED